MKLSTILKSFSKNKTLVKSIKTGLCTGIVIAIPVFFLIFYLVAKTNNKTLSQINSSQQSLLLKNFENAARYGDLVNAKEMVIQQGKSLGLINFYLCDKKFNEILPKYIKNDCSDINALEQVFINSELIYVKFQWKEAELNYYEIIAFSLILSIFLSIPILLLGNLFTYKIILKTIEQYSVALAYDALSNHPITADNELKEFKPILTSINNLKKQILESANRLNEKKVNDAIVLQAKQVAHDIRSPLSVLNLLIPTYHSTELDEKYLMISSAMKRVNEIAEALLIKTTNDSPGKNLLVGRKITEVLNNVVKEKLILLNDKTVSINVDSSIRDASCSHINQSDLSRIISNLINNALEAISDNGAVKINAYTFQDRIKIEITDNGKGIPPEVLSKIGTEGFSHQKRSNGSGYGMGVFHAKQTIEAINGKLEIDSFLGVGTKIVLTI